ncbi:hypothetical protein EVAR_79765_1 [Eumeta japonica]|uniref:Uncharacterized protein n=1 Tax=Eumeta variegata TaxID=151549 RepID=A0A4C1TAD5_EUMVA|nr:hypothetical protein EVAR_79765_1 [Eumeta japonica]
MVNTELLRIKGKLKDQNVKDECVERLKDSLAEIEQYSCLELDELGKGTKFVLVDKARKICEVNKTTNDTVANDSVITTECTIDDGNESEITMDEIMKALKRMKVGKAAGCDKVSSEMLRGGGGIVASLLYQFFNKCRKSHRVPNDWAATSSTSPTLPSRWRYKEDYLGDTDIVNIPFLTPGVLPFERSCIEDTFLFLP